MRPTSPTRLPAFRAALPLRLFLLFLLWALLLTYPLPLHLFSHVPRGSEEAATVPFFNLWTLRWNIDQLLQGYPRYWDAPIFAPDSGAFAFSEPQPVSTLLAAPLWLVFQAPALGYNFVIILFLTLNGWFAYWLLRGWGLPPFPALLAGLLVQALPFVAQEMGVLQLTALFGFLWSLFFLNRLLATPSGLPTVQPFNLAQGNLRSGLAFHPANSLWRSALGLALGGSVTFFTCAYYGLFSLIFLPLAALFHLRRDHASLKRGGRLLAAGLLALALTGPLLWAQHERLARYGFSRTAPTIESNSARPAYYGAFLDYNILYAQLLGLKSSQGQRLFPGFGLVMLAVLGLLDGGSKRVKFYCLTAVLLALLLSLGLRLNLGGWQPYQWLRDYLPGLAQLRSPFRFAALVQLHLALLAGFGLHNLGRWFHGPQSLMPGLVAGVTLLELLALPLPLQPLPPPPDPAPWQIWLNRSGSSPKIVLLPFAPGSKVEDFEQTTRWMWANRPFQGSMLNGYSGFFPADHARLRDELLKFPSPAGLELLRAKGIEYVVVYHSLAQAPPVEAVVKFLPQVYWDQARQVGVYRLRN